MKDRPVGAIKIAPSSFIVQELTSTREGKVQVVPLYKKSNISGKTDSGDVTLFHLTKIGWTTQYALQEVARQFEVGYSALSSHGLKDRHAYTSQLIGVWGPFTPKFFHSKLFLHQVGATSFPLNAGANVGNRFRIDVLSASETVAIERMYRVANFFGLQRVLPAEDLEVGRMLIEGKFEKAGNSLTTQQQSASHAKRLFDKLQDWKRVWLHPTMRFELRFKMQKWQSQLWNQLAEEHILTGNAPDLLPVWSRASSRLYQHLWEPESVDNETLEILPAFNRRVFVFPTNITYKRIPVGWEICFDLPSGSYATVALAQIFRLIEPPRT